MPILSWILAGAGGLFPFPTVAWKELAVLLALLTWLFDGASDLVFTVLVGPASVEPPPQAGFGTDCSTAVY